MIENRLKHELYSSQFLRYLYLNTPLLIYPTETVLGTDGLMDGLRTDTASLEVETLPHSRHFGPFSFRLIMLWHIQLM